MNSARKKVLFLTNIPSPYRVDFFNEWGKSVDLTICCCDDIENYKHRNAKWFGGTEGNFNLVHLTQKAKWFGMNIKKDVISFLKQGWDMIIVGTYSDPTNMYAIQFMRRHHIKFMLEFDGGMIKNDNFIKYHIKKYFISSADGWIVSGNETKKYVVHYGADPYRCYLYPFTSLSENDLLKARSFLKQDKADLRKELSLPESKIVLSVGRFSYENGYGKGYDVIMKVAEKTKDKDIGYCIVGDEPTEEFKKWKEDKQLDHVHFIGFKKKEELYRYYAAADLFILMTRGDVWGLVINEAMMYGLPIITTDTCVAGLELVKDNENGYIVNVDGIDNIVKDVLYLLKNDEIRESFGKESLRKIQPYVIENMAKKHQDILDSIGGGRMILRKLARNRLNIKEEKMVLYVGQMIYRKGIDVLLNAVLKLDSNIGFYLVGGEPTEEYKNFVKQHNLSNVHFVGFKTKEELRDYYMAANAFVLPTREDIWGLVVNEALSYGLPVITTNKCVSGLELIKARKNGRIVNVDDFDGLAKAIQTAIVSDESPIEPMYSIQQYTIENMAIEHDKIMAHIC